jgi:hypothetical protein
MLSTVGTFGFLDAQKQALPGGKRLTKKNTRWCGQLSWSHQYNVQWLQIFQLGIATRSSLAAHFLGQ